ncbi:MAG: hypothetical protein ACTSUE_01095 [Promethearchaeota archaeon]
MEDTLNDNIPCNGHSNNKSNRKHVSKPRLGRRESEPHSCEINYLYDVLKSNFPEDRPTWDLHHYFIVNGDEIDIQFDVSWIRDLNYKKTLSSYHAVKHENKIPALAVNVLSKSTWQKDIGENVDVIKLIGIPVYVVFPSYHVASKIYKPPFLRVYSKKMNGEYAIRELHDVTLDEGGEIDWDKVIDCKPHLPFDIGLMKRSGVHEDGSPLFRMILIDPEGKHILLTEKDEIINEKDEIINEKDEIINEKDRKIESLKKELEKLKNL